MTAKMENDRLIALAALIRRLEVERENYMAMFSFEDRMRALAYASGMEEEEEMGEEEAQRFLDKNHGWSSCEYYGKRGKQLTLRAITANRINTMEDSFAREMALALSPPAPSPLTLLMEMAPITPRQSQLPIFSCQQATMAE
jgi:hypothetical protein